MTPPYKSPNFDNRTKPISMLVMHYTGMKTAAAALDRLCDPKAKVSAHYCIEEDGTLYQLVDEKHRAWHAGVGYWRGETDVNNVSIGIELVNRGHKYGYTPFPEPQIQTLITLTKDILSRHNIPPRNIIGHSDLAPDRKQDPGELFPWERLAREEGIGQWPGVDTGDVEGDGILRELGEIYNLSRESAYSLQLISNYGYKTSEDQYELAAFKNRFYSQRK